MQSIVVSRTPVWIAFQMKFFFFARHFVVARLLSPAQLMPLQSTNQNTHNIQLTNENTDNKVTDEQQHSKPKIKLKNKKLDYQALNTKVA